MSGGKKKYPKKRTYSEGEVQRLIRQSRDDVVTQVMYLFVSAVADQFSPTEEELVELMDRVQRYNGYISAGLVDYKVATESIKKKTGVELNLSRW